MSDTTPKQPRRFSTAFFLTMFSDFFAIWRYELCKTFRDMGMVIFFIIVPLLYPLLYSYIYSHEVVRDVPTMVVDRSNSTLSREYLRRVDATPEVSIVGHCTDMEEAKEQIRRRNAYGIIYVPEDFSEHLNTGRKAHISLYCDMSGLLYYKSLLIANTLVSLEMNKEIKIARSVGATERQGEIISYPIDYEDVALYNPTVGFASFLLPAVLILIIQQTLLLGIGLSAGTARERNKFHDLVPTDISHYSGALRIVFGKGLAYLTIYVPVLCYTLVIVPRMFGFIQLAEAMDLILFALAYLLACIFFAMSLSVVVRHRESCMMIFVFTSVPLLFISGVSWPGASIPEGWRIVSHLFPSTFGINGYIKIKSMGANLREVNSEYMALWLHTILYFLTTCAIYYRQVRKNRRHIREADSLIAQGNKEVLE